MSKQYASKSINPRTYGEDNKRLRSIYFNKACDNELIRIYVNRLNQGKHGSYSDIVCELIDEAVASRTVINNNAHARPE